MALMRRGFRARGLLLRPVASSAATAAALPLETVSMVRLAEPPCARLLLPASDCCRAASLLRRICRQAGKAARV